MKLTYTEIDNIFSYHPPSHDQALRYNDLREAAKELAHAIVSLCPASSDRSAAIRKLRECVMTANASIALEEK